MEQALEKAREMAHFLDPVNRILKKYHCDETKLIPILQEIQHEYKYLSEDVIRYVSSSLNIPASRVYGVATFYAHFSLKPKGKHIFKLCDGTACHVKKSHSILDALYQALKLSGDKMTSDDLMFTVETVSCLGACGLAPVMVVDEEVYGQITPEKAIEIVEKLKEQEKGC